MNNFSKRLIFGIVYVLLIVAATTTNIYMFFGLFFIFMLFSIYEFQKMVKLKSTIPYFVGSLLLLSALTTSLDNIAFKNMAIKNILFMISVLMLFSSFIIALLDSKKNAIEYLGKIVLTILYVVVPFLFLVDIPEIYQLNNYTLILGIFILTWTSDTFAYLVGRQFGKHKLFERISPKKTIEGFVGGVLFTLIAAYIISIYFTDITASQWIIISIIISIFGVIGDLIESMFKRQANIKDSSNLIPGHGGFLDRLDSLIFAIPFIYGFLYITKNLNLLLNVS